MHVPGKACRCRGSLCAFAVHVVPRVEDYSLHFVLDFHCSSPRFLCRHLSHCRLRSVEWHLHLNIPRDGANGCLHVPKLRPPVGPPTPTSSVLLHIKEPPPTPTSLVTERTALPLFHYSLGASKSVGRPLAGSVRGGAKSGRNDSNDLAHPNDHMYWMNL